MASGQVALSEAVHILAQQHDEHLQVEADLRDREAWVVTTILARSEAVWHLLPAPTLRFQLDLRGVAQPQRLEVGHYTHLSALPDLTDGEQELIASSTPCWARVYAHEAREEAGHSGALACAYVPMTSVEAVEALGLSPIVTALENAVYGLGSTLRAQMEHQNQRQAQVSYLERTLGWDGSGTAVQDDRPTVIRARLALLLLGHGGWPGRVLGVVLVAVLVTLVCLLLDPLLALIALPSVVTAVLMWERMLAS